MAQGQLPRIINQCKWVYHSKEISNKGSGKDTGCNRWQWLLDGEHSNRGHRQCRDRARITDNRQGHDDGDEHRAGHGVDKALDARAYPHKGHDKYASEPGCEGNQCHDQYQRQDACRGGFNGHAGSSTFSSTGLLSSQKKPTTPPASAPATTCVLAGSHFQAASEATAANVQATNTRGFFFPPSAMASRKQPS